MASTQISGSTLSLHGAPNKTEQGQKESASSRTGILVRLNEQVIRDLQQCAQAGKAVQLLGGKTPKIRYGVKLLELNVRPETFRHEIYSADDSNSGLGFAAFVSHNAELRLPTEKKTAEDSAGADAALEALKQSLASMAKQKEERKTTISSSVVPASKNSRYLQPRQPTSLSQRSMSSSSTPRPAALTSASSGPQAQAREKGMRFALVHLLAVRPSSEQDINRKTHIPKSQLSALLLKIADKQGLQWELSNKSYKELDPWVFNYTSDQRKLAIDHAIKAFDRLRIPKEDKAWQMLLPKEERNKGKILSRLHLTAERNDQAGTPGLAPTPVHTSAAATPKLGGTGTPRGGATTATGRSAAGISIEKRLKEAKKKGAMEKKKQEKEAKDAAAAASDRESKPRNIIKKPAAVKKVAPKVKSDEVVHSSDEEEGEVKETLNPKPIEAPRKEPPKPISRPRPAAPERRESSASEAPGLPKDSKAKPKPTTADRLATSTAMRKDSAISKAKTDAGASPQPASLPRKPESTATAKAGVRAKDTPLQRPAKTTSTTQRPQISPRRLTDTRPKVPSPLGTSPPRNASDYAEKPTKPAVKASSTTTNTTKPARPSVTTKTAEPLNFFGSVKPATKSKIVTKKRPLESDTDSAEPARKVAKSIISTPAKSAPNGTPATKPTVNGTSKPSAPKAQPARSAANADSSLKRKANDLSSGLHDHGAAPPSKHRKTESGSTHSHAPTNSSVTSLTTAPTVSPDPSSPARSDFTDDNLAGILDDEYEGSLTWEQARAAAETFRSKLYPEYTKLYRRIEQTPSHKVAKEDTVRLWQLHNRLEVVKHRIEVACRDGDGIDI